MQWVYWLESTVGCSNMWDRHQNTKIHQHNKKPAPAITNSNIIFPTNRRPKIVINLIRRQKIINKNWPSTKRNGRNTQKNQTHCIKVVKN